MDWLKRRGEPAWSSIPAGCPIPRTSQPRRAALAQGLIALAEHATGAGVTICVENMPPGVHPGSRMADLAELLIELNHPRLALALDTGTPTSPPTPPRKHERPARCLRRPTSTTITAGKDSHEPPGHGTIDWPAWGQALDAIGYAGPIMLECIRHLRDIPASFRPEVLAGAGPDCSHAIARSRLTGCNGR